MAILALAVSVDAADIEWGEPVSVSKDEPLQVLTQGQFLLANSAHAATVNGVTFSFPVKGQVSAWDAGFGPKDTEYARLSSGAFFSPGAGIPMTTLITGLIPGQEYAIQVFTPYYAADHPTHLTSGMNNVELGGTAKAPRYVIGRFKANREAQSFDWKQSAGGDIGLLSAFQVRQLSVTGAKPGKVAAATFPARSLPVPGELFIVQDHPAFLMLPRQVGANGNTPWVWFAPVLPGLPSEQEKWMFEKFLAAGVAVAGIDVGESYGSPAGRALFTALYEELTARRGLSKTPCLLARSRGGLQLYNWAVEHPTAVAGVAGIYPVCDLRSYPGLAQACGAYGLTADELQARLAGNNPIDRLAPLAQAHIPIYHLHGDSDTVVPIEKNSGELAQRYRQLGGEMTLKVIKGQGHNVWEGWFTSQELVEFVIAHVRPGPASKPSPEGRK